MRCSLIVLSLVGLTLGACTTVPAPKDSVPEPVPSYVAWREANPNVGIDDNGRAAILQVSGRMVVIAAGDFDNVQLGEPVEARIECGDSTITSHCLRIVHVAPRQCMAIVTFWCTPPLTDGVQVAHFVVFPPRNGEPDRVPESLESGRDTSRHNLPTSPGVDWSKWGVDEAFTIVGQIVDLVATRDNFVFLVNLELAEVPPLGTTLAAPEMTGDNGLFVHVVRHYHENDDKTRPVEQLGCVIEVADLKYRPAKGMRLVLPK
jgi:hypothetical protein